LPISARRASGGNTGSRPAPGRSPFLAISRSHRR
jgi:hypothetical protein